MALRRGFTLIEVIVASAIALVVALLVASLFQMVQHMSTATSTAYLVARDVQEGVRQLRHDLMDTALATVRPTLPADNKGTSAGVSMASARDEAGRLVLADGAAPRWQRWVLYTLQVESGSLTGNLVRWERPAPMLLPQICPVGPGTFAGAATQRVVIRGVAAPNVALTGVGPGGSIGTSANGGFTVEFLRLDGRGASYSTSPWNPAQVTTGQAKGLDFTGNTRLVQVRLQVYEVSGNGKPSYLDLVFRVTPRF